MNWGTTFKPEVQNSFSPFFSVCVGGGGGGASQVAYPIKEIALSMSLRPHMWCVKLKELKSSYF